MSIQGILEPAEGRQPQELALLLVAFLFVILNAVALSLAVEGTLTLGHFWAPAVWAIMIGISHWLLNRYRPKRDPLLLPIYALLTGWGLLLVDRLAANFLARQTLWMVIATATLVAIAIVPRDLSVLRRYRYSWLTLGLILLVATLVFGVNPSGAGASLWLRIPLLSGVYFQPSELMKLLLVVFLASYFDEQMQLEPFRSSRRSRHRAAFLAPLLLMWGFSIVLLVWQRDLGAATLFFVSFLTLLYIATGEWRYVLGGILLVVAAGIIGYFTFDVVQLRVDAWWNPWPDATDRAFQIVQSLYAIASGGLSGQGIGQGAPVYVPVVHSDFAFAAIAEEWGLIGGFTVLACFVLLGYRGLRTAALCRRPFYTYLAAGVTIMLCVQAFLIMGGVVKVLPLTGVTLPFVSYGGSSLFISSLMIGLLLYLSARNSTAF